MPKNLCHNTFQNLLPALRPPKHPQSRKIDLLWKSW
jgi:hypothetical protein